MPSGSELLFHTRRAGRTADLLQSMSKHTKPATASSGIQTQTQQVKGKRKVERENSPLNTAQSLNDVGTVVVEVPQLAVVALVRPPVNRYSTTVVTSAESKQASNQDKLRKERGSAI